MNNLKILFKLSFNFFLLFFAGFIFAFMVLKYLYEFFDLAFPLGYGILEQSFIVTFIMTIYYAIFLFQKLKSNDITNNGKSKVYKIQLEKNKEEVLSLLKLVLKNSHFQENGSQIKVFLSQGVTYSNNLLFIDIQDDELLVSSSSVLPSFVKLNTEKENLDLINALAK